MSKDRNHELTLYIGNLDEKVTESLLYELFLQVAPIRKVYIPKDRIQKIHQGFGFIEFKTIKDLEYVEKVMAGVKLYNKILKINRSNLKDETTGAALFIKNLNPMVTQDLLSKIFKQFGEFSKPPKIELNELNESKGYGFIYFKKFKDADEAIIKMNNQLILNEKISIEYSKSINLNIERFLEKSREQV